MANLKHLSGLIFNQPHLITPEYAETILAVIGDRLGVDTEGMVSFGSPAEQRQYLVTGRGTAVIPVIGSMTHRATGIEALSGMTSYGQLKGIVANAYDDPDVKSILFDYDSPGGMVAGCFDLRDYLMDQRGRKPTVAISRDSMCSAAYLLGSTADHILTTQTGVVGSIGVVAMHVDQSEANKKEGIKPTFIHAGKYKVAGNPHAPLEGEALEYLQESVMHSYDMFVKAVSEARALDEKAVRATEARVYRGEKAIKNGLADGIASFEDALSELAESAPRTYQSMSVTGNTMDSEQMETLAADLTNAQAEVANLRQKIETLQGQIIAEGYSITAEGLEHPEGMIRGTLESTAEAEMIEVAGQMVPTASLPEVVVTALKAAAEEKADAALTARATAELPNFATDVAKVLVAAVGDNAEVMEALKGANHVLTLATSEVGEKASETEMVDPKEKLNALINKVQAENPSLTYHQAYAQVASTKEGRALILNKE